MSLLSIFTDLNNGGWTTAGLDVQFKVINETLLFQCSSGASDWRYNFMAAEDVYKDSDIEFIGHKGFNELWESVRHDIEKLSFRRIAGYSQGGALAIRAHENYFHRFGFEPEVSITFGCPPSIKNPSRELSARFSHFVNWHNPRDLVYYAPMLIGYQHVGSSRMLKNIAVRPKNVSIPIWLSNHDPTRYMQNLKYL
jgi:hypothetical protein